MENMFVQMNSKRLHSVKRFPLQKEIHKACEQLEVSELINVMELNDEIKDQLEVLQEYFDYVWHMSPDKWRVRKVEEKELYQGYWLLNYKVYGAGVRQPYMYFTVAVERMENSDAVKLYLHSYQFVEDKLVVCA